MRVLRSCSFTFSHRGSYELRQEYPWVGSRDLPSSRGWRDCVVRRLVASMTKLLQRPQLPPTTTSLTIAPDPTSDFRSDPQYFPLATLPAECLPPALLHLDIASYNTGPILPGQLPSSLTSLVLSVPFAIELHFPANLRTLRLGNNSKHSLRDVIFPPQITELYLGGNLDSPLREVALPPMLRALELPLSYDESVEGVQWPSNLTSLILGAYFNRPIPALCLPSSLRLLRLSSVTWKHTIDDLDVLSALVTVEFGYFWDKDVSNMRLPQSLRRLRFGSRFNQSLDALCTRHPIQCPRIIRLPTVTRWRQPGWRIQPAPTDDDGIEKFNTAQELCVEQLPTSKPPVGSVVLNKDLLLFILTFTTDDQEAFEVMRTCSVTFQHRSDYELREWYDLHNWQGQPYRSLHCDSILKRTEAEVAPLSQLHLPSSLSHLRFAAAGLDEERAYPFDAPWPPQLVHLDLTCFYEGPLDPNALPSRLASLVLEGNEPLKNIHLPTSLRTLQFGDFFDQSLDTFRFPPLLTSLVFGQHFEQPIDRVMFPASLRKLILSQAFNQPVHDVSLPSGLRELCFGSSFNHPITNLRFPSALLRLSFMRDFDQSIANVRFPPGLRLLSFGREFNQPIDRFLVPPLLVTLEFGEKFNQNLSGLRLPPSLQRLCVGIPQWRSFEALCDRYPHQCPAIFRITRPITMQWHWTVPRHWRVRDAPEDQIEFASKDDELTVELVSKLRRSTSAAALQQRKT